MSQQARMTGITERTLNRLVNLPWQRWKVGVAEKWCAVCGMDFWDLNRGGEIAMRADWTSKKRTVMKAIRDMVAYVGGKKSDEARVAAALHEHLDSPALSQAASALPEPAPRNSRGRRPRQRKDDWP